MDNLAACHLMNGFVHVPHSGARRKVQHASAPSCQHVRRSLSLVDRRGLISPARGNARGHISAPASLAHTNAAETDEQWQGLARRMRHVGHSFGKMQNWAKLMPAMDANCVLRLPKLKFGDCCTQKEPGQLLLVSLQFCRQRLFVQALRSSADLHNASVPSLLVWLLRADRGMLEKQSTAELSLRGGNALVFNEPLVFDVQTDELHNLAVVIMLLDSFAEVGHCILGELSGANATSARHWREAIERPGQSIAQWHRLSTEW